MYQYLNLTQNPQGIKLKHLHQAMKPHIFRLKLQRGSEKRNLIQIVQSIETKLAKKEDFGSTELQVDQHSYLDDEFLEEELKLTETQPSEKA